ncbi:hypothetical protein C8J56DRAFT_900299 [Mycena floridula]|nr:hypothetical protein C8J56DRAFT_900299 [Mycena floridula]
MTTQSDVLYKALASFDFDQLVQEALDAEEVPDLSSLLRDLDTIAVPNIVAAPSCPPSASTPASVPNPEQSQDNRRRRLKKQSKTSHSASSATIERFVNNATFKYLGTDFQEIKCVDSAYTGAANRFSNPAEKKKAVAEMKRLGDLVFLDAQSCVIIVFQAPPQGNDFLGSARKAYEKIMELGQGHPFQPAQSEHRRASFQLWFPDLYEYYQQHMEVVWHEGHKIQPNWPKSVYACCTINFGGQVFCFQHPDSNNLAFGMCAITALGNFDEEQGGHIVFDELELIVEFPHSTTCWCPSASLTHSNIPI